MVSTLARRFLAACIGVGGYAARWSGSKSGLALVYHRLVEAPGDPERELVPALPARAFEWQLRHIRRHYRPVRASELRTAALSRRRGRPFPVAVTFDDDLPSHRLRALPALQRVGLPATFFLCGASLDAPFAFWWERLQLAADRGVAPASFLTGVPSTARSIHSVSEMIQTMAPPNREAVLARLTRVDDGPTSPGMPSEDVRALVAAGLEIGFHTLHHHPLPTLDDQALWRAMSEGRERLGSLAGLQLTAIAYPHGRADRRVVAAARGAGFAVGFTTAAKPVRASTDRLLMGRLEPPVGEAQFALAVIRVLLQPARNSGLGALARRAWRYRRQRSGRERSGHGGPPAQHADDLPDSLTR